MFTVDNSSVPTMFSIFMVHIMRKCAFYEENILFRLLHCFFFIIKSRILYGIFFLSGMVFLFINFEAGIFSIKNIQTYTNAIYMHIRSNENITGTYNFG